MLGRKRIYALFFVCALSFIGSCKKDSEPNLPFNPGYWHWEVGAGAVFMQRAGAVSFVIDNKAYVGLGYDGYSPDRSDFHVFDVNLGYWDKTTAPFPGVARSGAVSFSLNGKGYVGTGFSQVSNESLRDFWEYDPVADTWARLNDFGGGSRQNAVAFVGGNYGYVGTGFDTQNYLGDFWQYDPVNDTWLEILSYDGAARQLAVAMTISSKVYITSGTSNGGDLKDDIWEFDPALLEAGKSPWTNLTPSANDAQFLTFKDATSRFGAVTFTLSGKGYITTGTNWANGGTNYRYDPATNKWTQMATFLKGVRSKAVAFVVADQQNIFRAFVTTGVNGNTYDDDMWEFNFETQ